MDNPQDHEGVDNPQVIRDPTDPGPDHEGVDNPQVIRDPTDPGPDHEGVDNPQVIRDPADPGPDYEKRAGVGGQVGPPAYKPLISRPCTHVKGTAGSFYTPRLAAVSAGEFPSLQDFMLINPQKGSFVYNSQLYYKQSALSLLLIHCSTRTPIYRYRSFYASDGKFAMATFLHKLEWLFL